MSEELPSVLGSGSVSRRAQLERLGIAFQTASSDFGETPLTGEGAREAALRLTEGKARSLVGRFPVALVTGADQVAWCGGRQLGKSVSVVVAQQILATLSGKVIEFYSAIVLLNIVTGRIQRHAGKTVVTMRGLGGGDIRRYLERGSDAVCCAGVAKSEGLSAMLLARIDSTDPNALIGLPLFRLIDFLRNEGVEIL